MAARLPAVSNTSRTVDLSSLHLQESQYGNAAKIKPSELNNRCHDATVLELTQKPSQHSNARTIADTPVF